MPRQRRRDPQGRRVTRSGETEYEARKRRARERGLSLSQARGHPRRGEQPASVARPRRARGRPGRKILDTEAGTVIRDDAALSTILARLRRADERGQKVAALVTIDQALRFSRSATQRRSRGYAQRWLDGRTYRYPLEGRFVMARLVIGDVGVDPLELRQLLRQGAGAAEAGMTERRKNNRKRRAWEHALEFYRQAGQF